MRDYLVWVSANHASWSPKLFSGERKYDIVVHDYGPSMGEEVPRPCGVEYWFPSPHTEKFETAAKVLPTLPTYKYVAFLDDDLDVDTNTLNRLFLVGDSLGLDLFQPALTLSSFSSHQHLYENKWVPGGALRGDPVRLVSFVEIMCPFFSNAALQRCLPLFDLNVSGWGLDIHIWPKLVDSCWVIDSLPIGHYRQPGRRDRVLRNGLTSFQEYEIVNKINYDGDKPW